MSVARLYFRYDEWPRADRNLWDAAFDAGIDPFDELGAAAHLAERTKQQLQYAYGKFLFFLAAHHRALLTRSPTQRLNRKIIEAYVQWQPKTCGGVTIGNYLCHLWHVLRYIGPREDWSWLLTISKQITAQAKRKPEKHHLVTSETLYALGLHLMDQAVTNGNAGTALKVTQALDYRNGLIIALLALIPLRRRTVAALRVGKHLIKSGDRWSLDIPAEDVKTKRPLEFAISAELSRRIDVYLERFRPHLGSADKYDHLWASSRRRPMSDRGIYAAVRQCTREALGFPVNLHRFRRAAATFWSSRDPANVRGAKDLLGHASFCTTEKYYIMAQSRLAGRALASSIDHVRNGPASLARARENDRGQSGSADDMLSA